MSDQAEAVRDGIAVIDSYGVAAMLPSHVSKALGGAVETTVVITNWDEAKTSLKSMYVLDGVPVAALDPIPWTSF